MLPLLFKLLLALRPHLLLLFHLQLHLTLAFGIPVRRRCYRRTLWLLLPLLIDLLLALQLLLTLLFQL